MGYDDYLRDQAGQFRCLADSEGDDDVKQELLELAIVCEEVADAIEDHLTAG